MGGRGGRDLLGTRVDAIAHMIAVPRSTHAAARHATIGTCRAYRRITDFGVEQLPAAKSERSSLKKRLRNQPLRSRAKTHVRAARKDMADGDFAAAERSVKMAAVALDKAASKGALHPNNAARRKSRLMRQLAGARGGDA